MDTHFLDDEGKRVLSEIATLESTKDVMCWTSFRELDSFISSNQYSNFAVLAKITAVKALLRAAWEKASIASANATLTADDLNKSVDVASASAAMDDKKKEALASFAKDLGMKAYKDYRTTSEHWRLVLSVITDEIAYSGNGTNLKPLDPDALAAYAELATRLSLLVLQASGDIARDERSPLIDGAQVKRAHADLSKKLGLFNALRPTQKLPDAEIVARLSPLTKSLIEGKITALQTYNKDSKDLLTDLNRVTPKFPVTQEAIAIWTRDLQSFTHFVAGGYEPMQADNFLADGNFAPKDQPRIAYVDATRAEDTTLQLFPHLIMPNGDVKLRFEPNPGAPGAEPGQKPRKAFDELMLDYQQNAVRDTAWHWILMRNVENEKVFAMDPFAAEYVSEVLSMMMTHYLVRGAELAKAAKKTTIDADIAKQIRDRDYVMVMPHGDDAKAWTPEQWRKKDALLAKYPKALFQDVTAKSGLPTTSPKIPEKEGGFDIQEAMGAGIAVGDLNGDGYPDLFLAGEGLGRLYLNKGKGAPGMFVDATAAWHVPDALDDSHGALFADFDGDGAVDLLVMRSEHPSLLLKQDGGTFTDVADKLGFKTHNGAHVAQAFDYDNDGDLDIYVAYYGADLANQKGGKNQPSMDGKNGSPHQLWKRGADGKYADVAAKAGVADVGWTLTSTAFDYDNDGDLDLFLANDFGADSFYKNNGDGTFADVSKSSDTDDRGSGMNATITDVNEDGFFDLYVSNIDMFSKNIKVVFPTGDST
ncbi:MAG: VCBS repeat-containing protein, partial [Polyangiaceae bacterium]